QVSTMASNIKFPNIEYQSHSAYTSDYTPLVAAQRPLVPIKRNILNTAQYTNKAENIPNIVASGGVMCEFCNSAYRSQLYWDVIDDLVSQGVVVHYQSAQKTSRKNIPSNNA